VKKLLLLASIALCFNCTTRLIYSSSNKNPEQFKMISSDINRFWESFEQIDAPEAIALFETNYHKAGSKGLKAFYKARIESSEKLVATVKRHEDFYAAIKPQTVRAKDYKEEITAIYRKLNDVYEDAVFPNVYLLVGRMTSGGTLTKTGLLIGTEMYGKGDGVPMDSLSNWHQTVITTPDIIPVIVAHELIHYQQKYPLLGARTLLRQSINEGAADYVGELISGIPLNERIHEYGDRHEQELWEEFKMEMLTKNYSKWLYNGNNSKDRPADLGYYMGYKICEAYAQKIGNQQQAIKDILEV